MSQSLYQPLLPVLVGFVALAALVTLAAVFFEFPYPGVLLLILGALTLLAGVYSLLLLPALLLPLDQEVPLSNGSCLSAGDAQNVAISIIGTFVCLGLIFLFYMMQAVL